VRDSDTDRQTLLLFRSGEYERLAVPLSLVARLEEFPRAKIERASGRAVVQYRGQILPLVPLDGVLGSHRMDMEERDPVQVIVFSDGDRRIGILVDQIVDIVEDVVVARQKASTPGLLGSAVVGEKVTDFLDLRAVIDHGVDWSGSEHTAGVNVLVAESSHFARGLVRHYLEMAGHRAVEAASVQEAIDKLQRHRIDVAAVSLDLAGGGGAQLVDRMRKQTATSRIPVVALTDDSGGGLSDQGASSLTRVFDDFQRKFDREAMLRSVERLAVSLSASQASPVDQRAGALS
jgi:two-component system chemotaxis sensor kinase CheA